MAQVSDASALVVADQAVQANAAARSVLVEQTVAHVRALVAAFTQWYDDLAVRRLAHDISDAVRPAQQVMAAQQDAYLAHVTSELTGKAVRPVGPIIVDELRGGGGLEQAYERLGEQYRYFRSVDSPTPPLQHVLTRASVMSEYDIALAARAQTQASLAPSPARLYRRVIHPELARTGTCGLCIAAAQRLYHKRALLPIHARCNCDVLPVVGGLDVGQTMNDRDLRQLYKEAGGTSAADLKKTRYQVDDHGELGPTLLPKKANPTVKSGAVRPGGLKALTPDQLRHQIATTEALKPSEWRTKQLDRLRSELAGR